MKIPWNSNSDHILALFGRGIAFLLALEMLQLWPDLGRLYGQSSIVDPSLLALQQLGTGLQIHSLSTLLPMTLIAGTYLLCCALVVINWYSRTACIVLMILHHTLLINDYNWAYGADYIAYSGLCIYFLFGRTRTGSSLLDPKYGLFLLRAHLTLIYFFGGLSKSSGIDWYTGAALWKALQHMHVGALIEVPLSWARHTTLWQFTSWAVIVLELGYFTIWCPAPLRRIILFGTVIFHVGISVALGLHHFAALMIWFNVCAWYLPYLYTTDEHKYSPLATRREPSAGAGSATATVIQGKEVF